MFALAVNYLTRRTVATHYNDRNRPEWPPHPARLFSALVATYHAAEPPDLQERAALEWLETLGAPQLAASEASTRQVMTVFVPVNDTTLMPSWDTGRRKLELATKALADAECALVTSRDNGGTATALASLWKNVAKASKARDDAQRKLMAQVDKDLAAPGKDPAKAQVVAAAQMLPEHRVRQARVFPSASPLDPTVCFVWPEAEVPAEIAEALDRLVARLTRLGHSSSLVHCSVTRFPVTTNWTPDESGQHTLRVVRPGQLLRLEQDFERHQGELPRTLPCAFQRYRQGAPSGAADTGVASWYSDTWYVLRRVDRSATAADHDRSLRPMLTAGPDIAETVRYALMSHCRGAPLEILSGHLPDRRPTPRHHLAIVPLPFTGGGHADGAILGVALVLPRDCDEPERRHVLEALAQWEDAGLELGLAGQRMNFVRELDRSPLVNLRPSTWCAPSQRWVSVTPVALDANPGGLYVPHEPRDPEAAARRQAAAFARAQATISEACLRIGLPEPVRVVATLTPLVTGSQAARRFSPFPRRTGRLRRVLMHAELEFATPVAGPVILGAGRFLGLGLFRPIFDDGEV